MFEAYKYSEAVKQKLFRITKLIWNTEVVPAEMLTGIFIMLYKKNSRDDYGNYRCICLLCHCYKLLSEIIARLLHIELADIFPDSQAGFRPARGTRGNICILKWTIIMILGENCEAVVAFIDYKAAFDTKSQPFLDNALSCAGVSIKVSPNHPINIPCCFWMCSHWKQHVRIIKHRPWHPPGRHLLSCRIHCWPVEDLLDS